MNTTAVHEFLRLRCTGASNAMIKSAIAEALDISERQVELTVDQLIKYERARIFSTTSGDCRGYWIATIDDIDNVDHAIATQQSRVNEGKSRLDTWKYVRNQLRHEKEIRQRAAGPKQGELTI